MANIVLNRILENSISTSDGEIAVLSKVPVNLSDFNKNYSLIRTLSQINHEFLPNYLYAHSEPIVFVYPFWEFDPQFLATGNLRLDRVLDRFDNAMEDRMGGITKLYSICDKSLSACGRGIRAEFDNGRFAKTYFSEIQVLSKLIEHYFEFNVLFPSPYASVISRHQNYHIVEFFELEEVLNYSHFASRREEGNFVLNFASSLNALGLEIPYDLTTTQFALTKEGQIAMLDVETSGVLEEKAFWNEDWPVFREFNPSLFVW